MGDPTRSALLGRLPRTGTDPTRPNTGDDVLIVYHGFVAADSLSIWTVL
jgi:hypothetical protein